MGKVVKPTYGVWPGNDTGCSWGQLVCLMMIHGGDCCFDCRPVQSILSTYDFDVSGSSTSYHGERKLKP